MGYVREAWCQVQRGTLLLDTQQARLATLAGHLLDPVAGQLAQFLGVAGCEGCDWVKGGQ